MLEGAGVAGVLRLESSSTLQEGGRGRGRCGVEDVAEIAGGLHWGVLEVALQLRERGGGRRDRGGASGLGCGGHGLRVC